ADALTPPQARPGPLGLRARGHDGVRRQRPGPARPSRREPALDRGGCRHGALAGYSSGRSSRRGRGRKGRRGGRLHRPRPWGRRRRGAAVRAERRSRGATRRGGDPGIRGQRRPGAAAARLSAAAGRCELRGRAWSGIADISGVEVSTDDGESWSDAEVERDGLGRWAWRAWRLEWDARPGEFVLCSRARDAAGNVQPLEPSWNVGGYANNAVQRVGVPVTGARPH